MRAPRSLSDRPLSRPRLEAGGACEYIERKCLVLRRDRLKVFFWFGWLKKNVGFWGFEGFFLGVLELITSHQGCAKFTAD